MTTDSYNGEQAKTTYLSVEETTHLPLCTVYLSGFVAVLYQWLRVTESQWVHCHFGLLVTHRWVHESSRLCLYSWLHRTPKHTHTHTHTDHNNINFKHDLLRVTIHYVIDGALLWRGRPRAQTEKRQKTTNNQTALFFNCPKINHLTHNFNPPFRAQLC